MAKDPRRPGGEGRRGSDARRPAFDPRQLQVREQGGAFTLHAADQPVRTPGGTAVAGSRRFVELVRREAEIARGLDPHALSAFALFCAQKDHVEAGRDPIARELDRILREEEPVLEAAEDGPEEQARRACWPFLTEFLAGRGPQAIVEAYGAASPAQRTAVALLFRTHHAGVMVPLMLALGRCSASEYAEALMAMHRAHPRIFDPDWKAYTDNFVIAREDATIVEEYLRLL